MVRVYFDQDAQYLRSLEEERIELVGPITEYYSLNRAVNVDTLYNEPNNDPLYGGSSPIGTNQNHNKSWNFSPDIGSGEEPLLIPSSFLYEEMDGRNPMVRSEGFKVDYDGQLFIARNHWECKTIDTSLEGRNPKEGDVLYVNNIWFDVIKVGTGGNILNSPVYVGFRFELKRRTEFVPERKI